jgi:hydrogenase 3 maturation protease
MEYLVLCVGNRDGGDDSIGPYIADNLESNKDITVIDCGTTPENYTSIVKRYKAKRLIIIDATDMNLKPGEIRIIPEEKIGRMHISTHGIPISITMDYLKEHSEQIFLIGIQPEKMYGSMTETVKKSGDKLIEFLKNKNIKKIEVLQ